MNDGTSHLYDTSSNHITSRSFAKLQCLFSSFKLHMWISQAAARVPYRPLITASYYVPQQKHPQRCEIFPNPAHKQLSSEPLVSVWLLTSREIVCNKTHCFQNLCSEHGQREQAEHRALLWSSFTLHLLTHSQVGPLLKLQVPLC